MSPPHFCVTGVLVAHPLLVSVSHGCMSPPHLCVTGVLLAHPLCCLRILYQSPRALSHFPLGM